MLEFSIFLIFVGSAIGATLALYARQNIIVAYILLGLVLGRSGMEFISDPTMIDDIASIGIIFLLYLLGLELLPSQLWKMLREAVHVTVISSIIFFITGAVISWMFGYSILQTILIGVVMMFSSTIIGLKLLPAKVLHYKQRGRVIISVLLVQDLIAIFILILLQGYAKGSNLIADITMQLVLMPLIIAAVYLLNRFILSKLIQKFEHIHEYIFLLAIAWCLGIAELTNFLGLSHEVGAFIAGVSLASSPNAFFITERLRPLRDFFLIIFFFSLGADFNIAAINDIILPAILLAAAALILKPMVFSVLLQMFGEKKPIAMETGFRLGQISEFSLLIALLAVDSGFIDEKTSYLIQLATLLTFIGSTYIIILRYQTPITMNEKLRSN